jgi:tetratricopeptide (TPR) repeat protein
MPWVSLAQYAVSERVGKKLVEAQELMSANRNAEAGRLLDGINVERVSDYEAALVYQFRGYLAHEAEDTEGAVRNFEKCLETKALPPAAQLQLRFNIAQLYLAKQNWPKAIENLKQWFREAEKPNGIAYYMLAIAYYQNDQRSEALKQGKLALAAEDDPQEGWIQLVLSLHLERSEYKEALPLLEQLVERFPKKLYWMQLSAIYAELGKDEQSLAVQQLVYAQGLLTKQSELLRLARLYLYHDLPYRGARVVEQGMEDGHIEENAETLELLGQGLMAAREFGRALEPMQRAAELSEKGDLWLRLGQIRIEREEWPEAAAALEGAIAKGDLDDPGTAHLLLGIARFNQDELNAAAGSFREAAKHDKTKKSAQSWLRHTRREQERG